MRMIDADALADALFEKRRNYPKWVADVIGEMPETIVRCKDCKHRQKFEVCNLIEGAKDDPDWFCADGERE